MSAIIYWTLVDSSQAPLENPDEFLASPELEKLSRMRFPKRRDEWLLGRWAAKALLQSTPTFKHYPSNELEIRNEPDGAPYLCLPDGQISPNCLSISHRDQLALCALASTPDLRVGIDLEKVEPREDAFVADYFDPIEQNMVNACKTDFKQTLTTLIWSAKESMLKALGVGLRRDTRTVEVNRIGGFEMAGNGNDVWQTIEIKETEDTGREWAAWWQRREEFVITLAAFTDGLSDIQSTLLVEKRRSGS
jgi:4'-phosphopantetheinyl transferase